MYHMTSSYFTVELKMTVSDPAAVPVSENGWTPWMGGPPVHPS